MERNSSNRFTGQVTLSPGARSWNARCKIAVCVICIDPDTLGVTAQVDVGESVFSRLIVGTQDGEGFSNMQGSLSLLLFRYRRDGASLAMDEQWGFVRLPKDGQVGTVSPTIAGD
ncbi:MAG: hypothetical protein OXI87_02815 [Albidovulum sp.]|nr:hypothetical protein [Albidovulum sp.]